MIQTYPHGEFFPAITNPNVKHLIDGIITASSKPKTDMHLRKGKIYIKSTYSSEVKDYECFFEIEDTKSHIFNMLQNIFFPKKWAKQGISEPNMDCKKAAQEVCLQLYKKYGIIPFRLSSTIEEGIWIYYFDPKKNRSLEVEIYNDLDIAALINDEKKKQIIFSQDIINNNFGKAIKYFRSK